MTKINRLLKKRIEMAAFSDNPSYEVGFIDGAEWLFLDQVVSLKHENEHLKNKLNDAIQALKTIENAQILLKDYAEVHPSEEDLVSELDFEDLRDVARHSLKNLKNNSTLNKTKLINIIKYLLQDFDLKSVEIEEISESILDISIVANGFEKLTLPERVAILSKRLEGMIDEKYAVTFLPFTEIETEHML